MVKKLPALFWLPALLVLALFGLGLLVPAGFAASVSALNQLLYETFGGFYLGFTLMTLVTLVGLAVSPLGQLRLGGPEARPEFSRFSWFAMLFCAGMGTGLMFWGAAEPLYHFLHPPWAEAVTLAQRQRLAFEYTFFHWGLHPWAIYAMTGLAIGFFGFNQQRGFNFSAFLLSAKQNHPVFNGLRFTIDFLTIVAIIFGIAATFGMGVLQLQGGLKAVLGLPATPGYAVALIGVMTVAYLASALAGVKRGIKILSDSSFLLYLMLLGCLLVFTPDFAMVGQVFLALPEFIARLPAMSLGWATFNDARWVADWTVKYWSWWIAWAPFVGIFIAFISRGRTVRELVFSAVLLPSLFSFLWFTLFGQAAIQLQLSQGFAGADVALVNVNQLLFQMMQVLTHSPWLGGLCLVIIVLDFINSADSATYTIANLSHGSMGQHSPAGLRVAWGLVFAVLTALFLLTGGIALLQEITLITALPFALLLAVVYVALVRAMWQDWRTQKNPIQTPKLPETRPTTPAG